MEASHQHIWQIGEILIQNGWVTWEDLKEALLIQKRNGGLIGSILIHEGLVSSEEITRALAEQYEMPYVNLKIWSVRTEAINALPKQYAYRHHVLPLIRDGVVLLVAASDLLAEDALTELSQVTHCSEVKTVLASPESIDEAIYRYYGPEGLAA